MIHELKILPTYYDNIRCGEKTFELRKDDRMYSVNDILILKEWHDGHYTGGIYLARVTYVLRNVPDYGLKEGFVILGIKEIT